MSRIVAFYFKVYGIVQGVAYRYSARKQASLLKVNGWVRNLSDGGVDGVAEGEETSVKAFLDWCRRGPSGARVDEIITEEIQFSGYNDFEIRYC